MSEHLDGCPTDLRVEIWKKKKKPNTSFHIHSKKDLSQKEILQFREENYKMVPLTHSISEASHIPYNISYTLYSTTVCSNLLLLF